MRTDSDPSQALAGPMLTCRERQGRCLSAGDIDLWPIYDRIRCPTLVLRGAESEVLTRATLQAMALRGPRPQTREVAGVGHAPMFLDAGQIAIARDFLLAA